MSSLERAAAAGEGEEPESFEVEAIIGASQYQDEAGADRYEYHCSFKGYGPEENLWIGEEELNCDRLIADYWFRQGEPEVAAMMMAEGGWTPVRLESDFEGKMAFAHYHQCNPWTISEEMLQESSA